MPFPFRTFAIHSPAALPISLLSAPMKVVYVSPSIARSRMMTGIPWSNTRLTIGVSGFASLGEMIEQVDLLPQEVLDVGDLLGVVLLRVRVGDLEIREVLGPRGDLRVHRDAPRLAEVALGEADEVLAGLGAAAAGEGEGADNDHRNQNERDSLGPS